MDARIHALAAALALLRPLIADASTAKQFDELLAQATRPHHQHSQQQQQEQQETSEHGHSGTVYATGWKIPRAPSQGTIDAAVSPARQQPQDTGAAYASVSIPAQQQPSQQGGGGAYEPTNLPQASPALIQKDSQSYGNWETPSGEARPSVVLSAAAAATADRYPPDGTPARARGGAISLSGKSL